MSGTREQRENDALILSRLMAMLHELPRREREAVLAGESFRLEADSLVAENTRYREALIRLREPGLSEAWVAEIIRVALEGDE